MASQPDSILIFDRASGDYDWFHQLDQQGVYFVTRLKRGEAYKVVERRKVDKSHDLTGDRTILRKNHRSTQHGDGDAGAADHGSGVRDQTPPPIPNSVLNYAFFPTTESGHGAVR